MTRLVVGRGSALKAERWAKRLCEGRLALVSEPKAFALFGRPIVAALRRAGKEPSVHLLPNGERAKSWDAVERLLGAMLEAGVARDGAVAALGGGAVTDAAGFAAGIFMRGVPWASLPTTLIGQLDSGLGGKTAINLEAGKNFAGLFHEPAVAVLDTSFLSSLPDRERLSGLAEALKYGLTFDPSLWLRMRRVWSGLIAGDEPLLHEIVERGARWKLKIVAQDPRETKGRRELLNFGHTLGHALEASAGFGALRHGEAVIWGMRAAVRLSVIGAGLAIDEADEIESFLEELPLPPLPKLGAREILARARLDKKGRDGKMRFVLLRALGWPVVRPVEESRVAAVIADLLAARA